MKKTVNIALAVLLSLSLAARRRAERRAVKERRMVKQCRAAEHRIAVPRLTARGMAEQQAPL